MTTRNEIYISALTDYVNDVKPYHSKITQIVEQFNFFDRINVKMTDIEKIQVKLSSTWSNDYYSDGLRTRYVLPPFLTPRYSTDINNYKYSPGNTLNYLTNFGISSAFQVNMSQGIESAIIDGKNGIEGYDYFLSKGIFSVQTTGTTWRQTNLSIPKSGQIYYTSSNPWMNISDIIVPLGSESIWEIKIVEAVIKEEFFSTQNFTISLDGIQSSNLYYEIYENNALIIPYSITELSGTSIQLGFTNAVERMVRVSEALDNSVFEFTTYSNTWVIHHTLNSTKIIPQCYLLLAGQYVAVLPLSITMDSPNQITVTFSDLQKGKVILREVSHQYSFSNASTISIPYNSDQIDYWVFIEQAGILTSVITTGNIDNHILTITFSQPFTGVVNYMVNMKPEAQFSITDMVSNTLIGLGSTRDRYVSNLLSFTPNFGGVLELGTSTLVRPGNQIAIHPNAIDEIWSIIKINPVSYDFPVSSNISKKLNLIPFAPAFIEAPAETWTLTYSASLKAFNISGSVSGSDFLPVKIGPWYDNGLIRIKLTLDLSQFPNDPRAVFIESYRAQDQYISDYTLFAIQEGAVLDGDTFTLVVNANKPSYLVYGSVSKEFEFATVGQYFWNGKIGFMPDLPYYSITPNQTLISSDLLPNGLMATGHYDQYGYGEYFDVEILETVSGQNTVSINGDWFTEDQYPLQWNIKAGAPLFDTGLYSDPNIILNFQKPPRFDAVEERFDLFFNSNSKPSTISFPAQSFFVHSDLVGPLPALIVGYSYSNFETSALSLTYGNCGAFNCTLMGTTVPIPTGTTFTISIKTNFIKPFHSRNVVIVKDPAFSSSIVLKTFNNDRLDLKIDASYPELSNNPIIQTFIKPSIQSVQFLDAYDFNPFNVLNGYDELDVYGESLSTSSQPVLPSRVGSYDLLLNNSPFLNAGSISYVLDTTINQFICVLDFDSAFIEAYLPINTSFSLTSHQTDEYNHLTGVMITEHVQIQDLERRREALNSLITDDSFSIFSGIPKIGGGYSEAIVSERNSGTTHILTSFDLIGYDLSGYELISNDLSGQSFTLIEDPLNPFHRCWYKTFDTNVTQLNISVPLNIDTFIVLTDVIYLDNSTATLTLIEGIDYTIPALDVTYSNPGFKTTVIDILPNSEYSVNTITIIVFEYLNFG